MNAANTKARQLREIAETYAAYSEAQNQTELLRSCESVLGGVRDARRQRDIREGAWIAEEALALCGAERELAEAQAECFALVSEARLREFARTGSGEPAQTRDKFWTWPVRAIESGWALGKWGEETKYVRHFFPAAVMPEIAAAIESAKFRGRHPISQWEEEHDARLVQGWVTNARAEETPHGVAVQADVNLYQPPELRMSRPAAESEITRGKLMAARSAGKLGLFSVSIAGVFRWKVGKANGVSGPICQGVERIIALDMLAGSPPGAGGKFLSSDS